MVAYSLKLKAKLVRQLVKPGDEILEIGCGIDPASANLANCKVSVIDIDGSVIAAVKTNHPSIICHCIDATKYLPIADTSIDVIVCYATLALIRDSEAVLLEMQRVLKTSGIAIIDIKGSRNRNFDYWRKWYLDNRQKEIYGATLAEAKAQFTKNGFLINDVYASGWTRFHLYTPLARFKWIERVVHSGREPDLDYILSNLPMLKAFASQWFFVVTKRP